MRRLDLFRCLLLLACTAVLASPAPAEPASSGSREVGSLRVDARDLEPERRRHELHAWLTSERVRSDFRTSLSVEVTPAEISELAREQRGEAARRVPVGVVKETSATVSLTDLAPAARGDTLPAAFGAVRATDDGGFVWTGVVHSPGASALRVHVTGLDLADGTELYVYDDSGFAAGPYSGRGPNGDGDFWTHSVRGEIAYLQLRLRGMASRSDLERAGFTVSGVGHIRGLVASPEASNLCADNADCIEDAQCHGAVPEVACARDAVARIVFRSGPWMYMCSGGLLNDSVGSGTPFFLTANHCISRGREASSMETYFFHENTSCGSSDGCDSWGASHTIGATILSTSSTGDYTLLRLAEPPPAGVCFLGWDAAPIAGQGGAVLHRISHPLGQPQAYSQHEVDPGAPTCSSWSRGPWIYSRDLVGASEGGSSGSPVLDADGQVVGDLSGGCGYNVQDSCDAASNATVDGAFAQYYDAVAPWLDPAGCPDADGDGYSDAACGGSDCDDSDPNVSPGAAEICGDGIDNDCSGAADCSDGACSIDPICGASCSPLGAVCDSNADCCSGKCRGRRGDLSCR